MKLIRSSLFWVLFFFISTGVVAQTSSLKGVIVSVNGDPISQASLYVNDANWAISKDDGTFHINNIPDGDHEILVSSVGYQSKKVTITLPREARESLEIVLEEKIYDNNPVVVTANRSSKLLQDVSVPVSVINQAEIKSTGSLRLSDLLEEQIGLNIVSDHGTGIQVQGFDPDYTLILIDNQPLIGRTAGTLDLTRLAVGNIEQIEIVKGPSSALWGSNALAGVINIITDKGSNPFSMDINGRYGTHQTMDGGINGSFKTDEFRGRFFGNYNRSGGYDLNSETVAPTIPEFDNITLSGGVNYRISKSIDVGFSTRYYSEDQFYRDEVTDQTSSRPITVDDAQSDISFTPEININLGNKFLIETNAFLSAFERSSLSLFTETNETYFTESFEQTLNRFESKASAYWNNNHTTVAGLGMNREDLTAEIYADVPFFDSYFAFGQHEWQVTDQWSVTGGFRFDAHSEYNSQLSPKFSTLFKISNKVQLRGSLGGGFKAPDFRQLFLNFTNPIAGYSVFGTTTVADGISRLSADGQIEELYFDPQNISEIEAEHSIAFNAGFDVNPTQSLRISFNAFRNNVTDLIETQRIALKTSGRSVFSYFNLDEVYTQGIETELRFAPGGLQGFNLSFGYQLLDAKREITKNFDRVVNGQVVSVSEKEFIPLLNRSKHSFNLKLFQYIEKYDIETSLRFNIRGRYWFADFNNNNIDEDNEYVLLANNLSEVIEKTIVNYALSKTFAERYQLQFGINNLFDFRDEVVLPSNPGRTFYTQLNIQLF